MNTLTRLTPAVMIAAAGATIALMQPSAAAVVPVPVVLLPTVHVTAQREALRTEIVQLPPVTVVGRRDAAALPGAPRVALRGIAPRS